MTKAELIRQIQINLSGGGTGSTGLEAPSASKADAEKSLNAVLQSIKTAMKKAGKEVNLRDPESSSSVALRLEGFGTFWVTRRNARSGISPLTKKPLKVKASKAVKFKPSARLKELL